MTDLRWTWVFLDLPEAVAPVAEPFWAAATSSVLSERRGGRGQFATLLPTSGAAPWVKVQRVGGPGGVHLDLDSPDRPAALASALDAGATHTGTVDGVEVMASPGGLAFCLTLDDPPRRWVRDGTTTLDQVCLDVPADRWEREVAFWTALTGWEAQPGRTPEFTRLLPPAGRPLRLLLQRLGSQARAVTAHPDFACADRTADVARHVALGAEVVAGHGGWTVLRAPGGQVYCLTGRDPATGQVPG